jgi:ArsR family transcriptional regulator
MDGYTRTATLMKALGHPARLQILAVLLQDEACVCHLEAVLGLRQAYISQHLMRLRDAGLVVDRREGMNVFYSLASGESIRLLLDAAQVAAAASSDQALSYTLSTRPASASCSCPKCESAAVLEV